jgi:hypothetical protein
MGEGIHRAGSCLVEAKDYLTHHSLLLWIQRAAEHGRLASPLGRLLNILPGGMNTSTDNVDKGVYGRGYPKTLANPIFWRQDPLFTSPIPKDIAASAGFWLLENSTDFSAATAFAAVFSEIQWPSHHCSTTALIRLRDTYVECFRAPGCDKSARLKALQSAAAYYVLYHTQLIWSTSTGVEAGIAKLPPNLPPDLFLHEQNNEWDRADLFEHLLSTQDRSEPVTSPRFLSYIAPYWFCGDSDFAIKVRSSRLQNLNQLIEVLETSHTLVPASLTDCILCVGAAMDLPLHPEDLIRVDKRWVLFPHAFTVGLTGVSDYLQPTFKAVVEHIHAIVLARASRHRYAKEALEILVTLAEKSPPPLFDGPWIAELLRSAAGGNMDDEKFTLFMRLSARRKEEETVTGEKTPPSQEHIHPTGSATGPVSHGGTVSSETPTAEDVLFGKIMDNVRTCVEKEDGWRDEAVYGGLIAIRDIPGLGSCLPKVESLRTLSGAMEKGEENESQDSLFRVRKAAHDAIVVARDGWFRSAELRPIFEELDIPRKLYSVVIETRRSDHQCSFLEMMEILSEDGYWHSYLRKAMEIWLPFRHDAPDRFLRILTTVGELPNPGPIGTKSLDKSLEKLVEEEWARIPARPVKDVTADRLRPLAEITEQLKELLPTECDLRAALGMVEKVIPSLQNRLDDDYNGPGDDIRGIVDGLVDVLRT